MRHARTLIPEYTCHRCLSLAENTHASGRHLKMRGKHAIKHISRTYTYITRRCFKRHFLQNCLEPLENSPTLPTQLANFRYRWRRNFSRLLPLKRINLRSSHSFVPFERIINRNTKIPITSAIILLSPLFVLFSLSLSFFYKVFL